MDHRIVFISTFSGLVYRGAERTADDFLEHFPGSVTIVSLAGCRSQGEGFSELQKAQKIYTKVTKYLYILDVMSSIVLRKGWRFIGKYNFFSSIQWIDWLLAQEIALILERVSPTAIIVVAGIHSAKAAAEYAHLKKIPIVGMYGGAASWNMLHYARAMKGTLVAHYPAQYEVMRRREPKIETVFIPLGVNADVFDIPKVTATIPVELKDLPRPIFFSTSALEPEKRIECLIDVIEPIQYGSLVIAGDGALRDKLLAKANRRLGNKKFRYLGVIREPHQLARFYQFTDVYCLASVNEPFGNVLLEAMACGKPVVASNDMTRRWMIRDAGVLTDVTDNKALAIALMKAAQTDWGEKPRQRAEEFSLKKVMATWADLLESLTNHRLNFTSPYEKDIKEMFSQKEDKSATERD